MFSQQVSVEVNELKPTASAGLVVFRQLVKQQKNYREMGFESIEELETAMIGDPFEVFMVLLDELSEYKQGQNADQLLPERKDFLFPVVAKDQVRSSLTVASTPKGRAVTSFGSPNKMVLLSKVRANRIETTKLASAAYFVVEVPGLKLVFVGDHADGVLMLTPVFDDATYKFKTGVPIPAEKAFTAILPAVKSHMDLPG